MLPAVIAISILSASAQNEIKFSVRSVSADEIGADAAASVDSRIRQALNRTEAVSDNIYNVFVVTPSIEMAETVETEGLMQEVGRVAANLTLTVSNSVDSVTYYSATFPLKGSAVGGKAEALKALGRSLKPTDPMYVRFVRTARQKIGDYYASNCVLILQRAQLLLDTDRAVEAMSYLSAVPVEVDCFESASAMIRDIHAAISEPEEELPLQEVDVAVEEPMEVPQEEPAAIPVAEPAIAPAADALPEHAVPQCDIVISEGFLSFRIISCTGSAINRRITILAEIINNNEGYNTPFCRFDESFSSGGDELKNRQIKDTGYDSGYIKFPVGIAVKKEFYINGVGSDITDLSHLHFKIGDVKITVRNLHVEWK